MTIRKLIYATIFCLALAFTTQAQYTKQQEKLLNPQAKAANKLKEDKPIKKPNPYSKGFVISSGIYWAGVVADQMRTTRNNDYREQNGFLRNSEGRLNVGKYYGIHTAIYGVTVLLQKKWPKAMNVFRSLIGGGHTVVAIAN